MTEDCSWNNYRQLKKYDADVSVANYNNLYDDSSSKYLVKVTDDDYSETQHVGSEQLWTTMPFRDRDMAGLLYDEAL